MSRHPFQTVPSKPDADELHRVEGPSSNGEGEWPGNIRELRNVIERAVVIGKDDALGAGQLPEEWGAERMVSTPGGAPVTLRAVEIAHITKILAQTNGRIGEAAAILGLHRNTLSRKLREYGL